MRCLFNPWIWDLDPDRINKPDHISESLETIFWVKKYLNSLMRIRDPGWKKFGSGMEKIRIRRDPG
jgi:hypothetical protein